MLNYFQGHFFLYNQGKLENVKQPVSMEWNPIFIVIDGYIWLWFWVSVLQPIIEHKSHINL